MKKSILLTALLAIAGGISAQNAPVNFETGGQGANWTWTVFENGTNPALEVVANPNASGINTSATVAKFTALGAGQPWAGTESKHGSSDLGPFVLSSSNAIIKIMVWKSVISDVGIKLASANGWSQGEIKKANTKTNEWEELTFDFSGFTNPPAAEGQLDQIIVFPDFNTAGRGTDQVVYFDNITFSAKEGGGGGETSAFCGTTVTHFGIAAETASAIKLTIAKVDARNMKVEIESADSDPVDLLVVNNTTGPITGSPAVSAEDKSVTGKISITLTWNDAPPAEIELNLLWSKVSFGGNWQLSQTNVKVAFESTCDGGGANDNEPAAAAPVPTRDASSVISLFSAPYTNVSVDTWRTDWSAATYSEFSIGSETVKKYSNLDFVGVETVANQINLLNMTHLHLDVWSPDFTEFAIKLVDFGANGAFGGGDDTEHQINYPAPATKTWVSYDIALDNFAGMTGREHLAQIIFVGRPAGASTVFLDNLYFYNASTPNESSADVKGFALRQNFPNPFNPSTVISYDLAVASYVTLEVFTMSGQKVATLVNGVKTAGTHTALFNAAGLSSGVYMYSLSSGNFKTMKKMLLIK